MPQPSLVCEIVFFMHPLSHSIPGNTIDDDVDDDEWHGVASSSGMEKDAEYQGEEVVATVTVVEDFDPSTLTTADPVPAQGTRSEEFTEPNSAPKPPLSHEKPPPKLVKRKVKEKKIYYETKQARKHNREKQRERKLEKAERAGGKASRQKRSKR
jgi:ribosomal RNA-processing protein 17